MQFHIFGDSIAWGGWDSEGGWVTRLKKHISDKTIESDFELYDMVFNLGISGDTTEKLLRRVKNELQARAFQDHKQIVIIQIGTNDSQVSMKTGENLVDSSQFKENIERLCQQISKYTKEIIVLGLTPVDENLVYPMPWRPEMGYKLGDVEKYNQILAAFCEEKNYTFINLLPLFTKKSSKNVLIDGVHPNKQGHTIIFEQVRETIEKKYYNYDLRTN